MVICPQCNIQHDPGEEFCRKCGKFLLVIEDKEIFIFSNRPTPSRNKID